MLLARLNKYSAKVRLEINENSTNTASSSNPELPHLISILSHLRPATNIPKDQIRILDLLPGKEDDDVKFGIRVVALSNNESYEALSYVWGETIGGKAVKQLRHPTRTRALWVDQLCINQWNNDEKAEQVKLMRLIYTRCSRCLIWLGDIPEEAVGFSIQDANSALDFIRVVAAASSRPIIALPAMLADSDEGERARKAFRNMVMHGNSWWSRIWTVQESVLPASAALRWGPLKISWKTMELAATKLSLGELPSLCNKVLDQYDDLIGNFMYPVRGLTISRSLEGPLDLLQRWRYGEATDPRYKVYALTGLLPHQPFPSIHSCDYSISPAILYSRVTLDLIRLESIKNRPWGWWKHSHRYEVFAACGNKPLDCASLTNDNVLSLKGVLVDKIAGVGIFLGEETWKDLSDDLLIETILLWDLMLDQFIKSPQAGVTYVGGGSWPDAFWRTMLGDLIMREFPIGRANDTRLFGNTCQFEFLKFLEYRTRGLIYHSLRDMVVNQAFFITSNGYIGIGPPNIQFADEVWVLFGGRVPFVLRPDGGGVREPQNTLGGNERFFIGDAYVQGIMDGEAVNECGANEKTVLIR